MAEATEFSREYNAFEMSLASVDPAAARANYEVRRQHHEFQYGNLDWSGKSRSLAPGSGVHGPGETHRGNRDRIQLMWEARRAMRDNPLAYGIVCKILQYAVPKAVYLPATGNSDADQKYSHFLNKVWARRLDFTGRFNLTKLARLWLGCHLVDGDCGVIQLPPKRKVDRGILKVQTIEADRIGGVLEMNYEENNVGGVILAKDGSPKEFQIYKRTRIGQYTMEKAVPAAQFVHISNPERPSEYRSRSRLAVVHQLSQDFNDSLRFEYDAGKNASSIGGFYRTADPNDPMGWDPAEALNHGTEARRPVDIPRSKLVALASDEKIDFLPSMSRPSGAFREYMELTVRLIANALCLPYGFVWDMSGLGGVTGRLEIEFAQRTMVELQDMLVDTCLDRLKEKAIDLAIASRLLPAVENRYAGTWHFGRWLTADIGHETQADLQKYNQGLTSLQRLCRKYDVDMDDLFREQVVTTERLIEIAAKHKMPVEAMTPLKPGLTEMMAAFKEGQKPPQPPPPPAPLQENPQSAKSILELLSQVTRGELPRENAVMTLIYGFGMEPEQAEEIVPPGPPPLPRPVVMNGSGATSLRGGWRANGASSAN